MILNLFTEIVKSMYVAVPLSRLEELLYLSGQRRRFVSPFTIQFLLLWPPLCGLHRSSFTMSKKFESQFFF